MIGGTVFVIIILILVFIFSDSETTSDTSSDTSSKSTSTPSSSPSSPSSASRPSTGSPSTGSPSTGSPSTGSPSSGPPSIPSVNCVGDWETCYPPCGEGSHNYKVTIPKEGDGKSCEEEDGAYKTCKIKDCPVNCVGAWDDCKGNNVLSPYCGDGTQKYKVTTLAKADGTICEAVDGASKPCKLRNCNCNDTEAGCGNWRR